MAETNAPKKSFLEKFKIKVGLIALIIDILTLILGLFLDEMKVEYVYTIIGSVTGLAAVVIQGHSKVDAEAVKLIAEEIRKETEELKLRKKKR